MAADSCLSKSFGGPSLHLRAKARQNNGPRWAVAVRLRSGHSQGSQGSASRPASERSLHRAGQQAPPLCPPPPSCFTVLRAGTRIPAHRPELPPARCLRHCAHPHPLRPRPLQRQTPFGPLTAPSAPSLQRRHCCIAGLEYLQQTHDTRHWPRVDARSRRGAP